MGEDWTAGGRPPAWFFERALAAVDRAVLAVDTAGRIRYWNGAAERLFGYSGAEALGRAAGELTGADAAHWAGGPEGADVRLRDSSGREFPAHVVSTPIVADGGEVLGALAFARDLTEVERTRVALATSERRFRAMFEHAQLPQVTADLDGRLVAVNPALRALLGDHPAAAPGARVADLLHPTDDQTATGRVEAILRGGRDADTWEGVLAAVDGSAVPVSVHVALLREADGTPCGLAAFAQDLRGQRAAERELSRRALRDDLTGLANRTLLNDRLQHALARAERRRRGGVAVLFVDLDQFKMVNDSWGHAAGDRLLVQVADRLSATVRHGDTVARFGGDKFVVVCDDADAHRAQEVAGRLLSALAAPFTVDGQRAYVRASVGIALSPPDTPTELLSAAESAMYDAKARGRGRMQIFDAAVAAETTDRMTLSNDLRESLEPGPPPADGERRAGGLALHYQPVVDLATGRILGVEALARWNHATRGHVSPAAFVDVAESTGLAPALGRWAVDRARRDTDTLRSALGSPLRIAVNISARHLADPALEDTVLAAFADGRLRPDELVLEITESAIMENPDQARGLLQRLRGHGVETAIDDFGTGYSSLGYLHRLPVTTLKIDRSFVNGITTDPDSLAITSSIIELARAMGLTTVAEGVETTEQLTVLRRLGCAAGQGFLWSPARPPAVLAETVRALPDGRFDVSLAAA